MTLNQFHALKLWHARHPRGHQLERGIWDMVLTLWLMGWVGGVAAAVLGLPWAVLTALALLVLPEAYVRWRARLHRAGRLRCDWISAIR
jgi:hypothetical protein